MPSLNEEQLLLGLLAIALILIVGRVSAAVARRLGQPEVLGELIGGFILGPSVFGAFLPVAHSALFLKAPVALFLSGTSWIGAILLLLVAGIEVDLGILRREARPGALGALFAIVPSLVAGSLFAFFILGRPFEKSFFLGIVLSVTAVSVVAKILMERGVLRREYGQVILAAGIASEVLVWLLVSVAASLHTANPALAGLKSAAFAVLFFAFMMTLGRRFTFWAMRRVADAAFVINGEVSLVLVLALLSAALTEFLGLHALLGAFVFGVLLSRSPRATERLLENIQTLTVSFFGPIFFVLAGMRVDILQINTIAAVLTVLTLLVAATTVKVGLGTVGARLGGLRGWESALVGVGLNLKGGTDVVVAIVGAELGLLTPRAYTMYTVVAIVTVLFTPALLSWIETKAPPTEEEQERLEHEEASRRSYLPKVERALVPVMPQLYPVLAAGMVEQLAAAKNGEEQLFDVTQFVVQQKEHAKAVGESAIQTQERLSLAGELKEIQITERTVEVAEALPRILQEAADYDLIALGARPPSDGPVLSFGRLQDQIIDHAAADILVAVDHDVERFDCTSVDRILIPINGMEYSLAAADVAGYLAKACDATLVTMSVVQPRTDPRVSQQHDLRQLRDTGRSVLKEAGFRLNRLGIRMEECVEISNDPAEAILKELQQRRYGLVVLAGVDRGGDDQVILGGIVHSVLAKGNTPAVVLIKHT